MFHIDELIERARLDLKSYLSTQFGNLKKSVEQQAGDAAQKMAAMQTNLGSIPGIQAKADQAINLTHLQINRITALESRLHLLEKHLKVEYFDGEKEIEKTVKEVVSVREYRKVK
jgi:hypothetical protein